VGIGGGELNLNLATMPTRAYRLIGSYTGSLNDMAELVSVSKRKLIYKYKLDEATEALAKLRDSKIRGRGVINP
jgi:propanol-preferring alcohol dehydrogenase